jgi:hypothetical protein
MINCEDGCLLCQEAATPKAPTAKDKQAYTVTALFLLVYGWVMGALTVLTASWLWQAIHG